MNEFTFRSEEIPVTIDGTEYIIHNSGDVRGKVGAILRRMQDEAAKPDITKEEGYQVLLRNIPEMIDLYLGKGCAKKILKFSKAPAEGDLIAVMAFLSARVAEAVKRDG